MWHTFKHLLVVSLVSATIYSHYAKLLFAECIHDRLKTNASIAVSTIQHAAEGLHHGSHDGDDQYDSLQGASQGGKFDIIDILFLLDWYSTVDDEDPDEARKAQEILMGRYKIPGSDLGRVLLRLSLTAP